MANIEFITGIVNDYEELGFGVKTNDSTLVGVDGEGEVSFEPLLDADGDVTGVVVYADGLNVGELDYDDEGFNEKLLKHVTGALNV